MPVVSHLRQSSVKSQHFRNSTIFLSFTSSIHSTLTYDTYVNVKYVKTHLAIGLNNAKRIFREMFLINPHDLVEKFSYNSDKGNCMLGKCSLCKSSEATDMKLDCSSDTDRSSETNPSRPDPG